MNGASPAHSSVSTTAVAGGGGSSGAAAGLDDFPFPPDIPSMQDRKDEAMRGLSLSLFPFDVFSLYYGAEFLIDLGLRL